MSEHWSGSTPLDVNRLQNAVNISLFLPFQIKVHNPSHWAVVEQEIFLKMILDCIYAHLVSTKVWKMLGERSPLLFTQ